jgi:hypothetical protein
VSILWRGKQFLFAIKKDEIGPTPFLAMGDDYSSSAASVGSSAASILESRLRLVGMDFCDPVLEGRAHNVIFHVAILESPFEGNDLPFLEGLGELREISPDIDAVPFSTGLV